MNPLKKNLQAIQQHHPDLLEVLRKPMSTAHIFLSQPPLGVAQLEVKTPSGEFMPLHDTSDPLRAIQRIAEQMAKNFKGVTAHLGFELGYLAKILCPHIPTNAALVLYEADPAIFLTALHVVDLTDVLSSPRIKIVVGPRGNVQQACSSFLNQIGGPLQTSIYGPAFHLAPHIYGDKVQRELSQISTILASMQNVVEWDRSLITENVLGNLPHVIHARGVVALKGLFPNIPAILMAAGPSLEKNVQHLAQTKGHAILIAADTALGYLLARNVIPDFVISVDPQEATTKKYEGLDIPQEVALVFHPATHHKIAKYFPGQTFTMDVPLPVYEWLQDHWPRKGLLDQEAMCQAHVGFNLAEWMGCSTIILVGHDLCFTENRMHVKGGGYLTEANEAGLVAEGILTQDIFGNAVKTSPAFVNDKRILEKKIRQYSGGVINATEGGLPIEGALSRRLTDVLAEYGQDQHVDVKTIIQGIRNDHFLPNQDSLLKEIRHRFRDAYRIERTARHVHQLLTSLREAQKSRQDIDPYFKKLENKVERLTGFIPRYTQALVLLNGMDKNIGQQPAEHIQYPTMDNQIDRGLRYYEGLMRVAPLLGEMLTRLAQRLDEESVIRQA